MVCKKSIGGRRRYLLLLLASLPCQAWGGDETTPPWTPGVNHLVAGEYARAVAALTPFEARFAGDPAYDLVLGSALFHSNDPEAALFPLERVLMNQPGNETARLLLAMTLYKAGDTTRGLAQAANLNLDQLSPFLVYEWRTMTAPVAAPPAAAPAATTGAQPTGKTHWQGHVQVAYGRDTNITVGPNDGTYIIPAYSTTFPISLGTYEQERDWVGTLSGLLNVTHTLDGGQTLLGGMSLHQSLANDRKDKEEGYGNAYAGVALPVGKDTVTPVFYFQDYQSEGTLLQRYWGAQLTYTHPMESNSLGGYLQYIDTSYPDYPSNNVHRVALGVTHSMKLTDSAFSFSQGLYGGQESAHDTGAKNVGFNLVGANLGTGYTVNPDLSLSASLAYEYRHHAADDPLYFQTRTDNQLQGVLSADQSLGKDFHLIPKVSYTHCDSNLDMYAYDRLNATLALQWTFSK
ncbi:MAG: DUF560 domain-containing protein [Magnetococcales bacterium]|nr:DUF560 domain-containing protein [Magnetococcales bacterium]